MQFDNLEKRRITHESFEYLKQKTGLTLMFVHKVKPSLFFTNLRITKTQKPATR